MNRLLKSNIIVIKQRGLTLIELLVSMLIGLIILTAVISMFTSMIKANNDYLKSVRLNQELRAAMSLITRDIRRSGANQSAATSSTTSPPTNPYASSTGTATLITIGTPGTATATTAGTTTTTTTTGSSISFSYDAAAGVTELYGYRLNSTADAEKIETCSGNTTSGCGTWQPVTDGSLVQITNLNFRGIAINESGINSRRIQITITGNLRRDTSVARTLTETIKVRNEDF